MKVGLTPDWIVHAACKVFELELPTIETPLIKGLLDPLHEFASKAEHSRGEVLR